MGLFKRQGFAAKKAVFSTGLLLCLALLWAQGARAAGIGVSGNQVIITTRDGETTHDYTATVDQTGLVAGVDAMEGTSLDNIAVGLVKDGVSEGTYIIDLGFIVDNAGNDFRVEAFLPGVKVQVEGGDTTVTVPAGSNLRIAGRSHDGGASFLAAIENHAADGPVASVDNRIVFSLSSLKDRLLTRLGAGSGNGAILESFLAEGRYAYTVLVKSPDVAIGYYRGMRIGGDWGPVVTPFSPSYNIGPDADQFGRNLSVIGSGAAEYPIASNTYLNGTCYVLRGAHGIGTGNNAPAPGALPSSNSVVLPPPTLTGISPNTGYTLGWDDVIITGSNFRAGIMVSFGTVLATSVDLISSTRLSCTTPAHGAGDVGITVTNSDGSSVSGLTYTYKLPPPYLSGISPGEGPAAGGTTVTLYGENFLPGAVVFFGPGRHATNVVVHPSGRIITCTTPAKDEEAGGLAEVKVRHPEPDYRYSDSKSFSYFLRPALSGVSPNTGSTEGGEEVAITGEFLILGNTVTFGGRAAAVTNETWTTIYVTAPAHPEGPAKIVVTDRFGQANGPVEFEWFNYTEPVQADFSANPFIGVLSGNPLQFTVHFEDRSLGADTYSWDFDGDGTEDSSEPNPAFSYTAEGDYSVTLSINDGADQLTKTGYIRVLAPADLDPPVASIFGLPNEGSMVNQRNYTITIGGDDVVQYTYSLNGGAWNPVDPIGGNIGAPATTTLVLSDLGSDQEDYTSYTLRVCGRDSAGNWQTAEKATTRTWKVDIKPPTAVLEGAPADQSELYIADGDFSARVVGDDVKDYVYRWSPDDPWSAVKDARQPITDMPSVEGVKTLYVRGRDPVGNRQGEGADATVRTWTVNQSIPTAVVSVSAPADLTPGATVKDRSAVFTVANGTVAGYKYRLENTTDPLSPVVIVDWQATARTGPISAPADLPDGAYTLYVNAVNGAGTWQDFPINGAGANGEDTGNATRFSWTIDATPPDPAPLTAEAGIPATSAIKVSWSAVEDNLKSYRLRYSKNPITEENWAQATKMFPDAPGQAQGTPASFTVTGLQPDTPYYFALKSEDRTGNLSPISRPDPPMIVTAGNPPSIASFGRTGMILSDPDIRRGHNGENREITITGGNFVVSLSGDANTVIFRNTAEGGQDFSSLGLSTDGTVLRVDVSRGAPVGTYQLQVSNGKGLSGRSAQTYEVTAAPVPVPEVSALDPPLTATSVIASAPVLFEFRGNNLASVSAVQIRKEGENPIDLSVEGGTQYVIHARLSSGNYSPGHYSILITSSGQTYTVPNLDFEITSPPVFIGITGSFNTDQGLDLAGSGGAVDLLGVITSNQNAFLGNSLGSVTFIGTTNLSASPFYEGIIDPPVQIQVSQEWVSQIGADAVVLTMGNPTKTIHMGDGQAVILEVNAKMKSDAGTPKVYFLDKATHQPVLGGIDPADPAFGIPMAEFRDKYGEDYVRGGTVLSAAADSPEPGYTTYTLGLLINHMSEYAAAVRMSADGLSPSSGPLEGQAVTITGVNFTGIASVTFGGVPAIDVALVSSTEITCTAPAHGSGAVDVTVTGTNGQVSTLANAFTYRVIPVIASQGISPATGLPAGGTPVTISGANFMPGVSVTFGGIPALNVVSSDVLITCETPAHAAGTVDVVVTNPGDEGSATATNGFTFAVPPTPPVTPGIPGDNQPITTDTTIPSGTTVTGNTIGAGVTVINNGTMNSPANNGVITGGTLGGTVTNTNGTVQGVTLAAGTTLNGGRVTGNVSAEGDGATVANAIIDATSLSNVTIGAGCRVTRNTVANNPGLDLTAAVTNSSGTIGTATPILVDDAGNELTLAELIESEANRLLGGATCNTLDDAAGNTILSSANLGNVVVPAVIASVATTADSDGASITPDGELLIVRNGIAFTMAPASADEASFASALQGFGADYAEDGDRVMTITLPDGARLVLRFNDFAVRPGAAASIAAVGGSFSLDGDPADPASYSLVITYPDGTTQSMPPFIHALGAFRGLARDAGATYRVVPSSGVIEVMGADGAVVYRGRPDYFLAAPTAGGTGLSFESAGDVNGDGLEDVYMITPSGRQILYTLPLN